ncbi:MAG: hypothetical protein ACRDKY_09970 [Solirubrobacteraceae bacterium]
MDSAVAPTAAGAATAPAVGAFAPVLVAEPAEPAIVEQQPMGSRQRSVIGGLLMFTTVVLMSQLVAIWPAVAAATSIADPPPAMPETPMLFGLAYTTLSTDVVLMAMVLIVGSLGALVGVTRRFLYFAGRDQLTKRDEWSYLMRPVQGAMLALIVYFTLRGGYLGQDQTAPVNPYGVAALSALVGLFTRHAVSKLTDVFDTLFGKPKEEENPVTVHKAED